MGDFSLKKAIAKQLFDEYNILTKEILNLLSVALFLPNEKEDIFTDEEKLKIKKMLENFDANKLIDYLQNKRDLISYKDENNIFFKFIDIIERGKREMRKKKEGDFKIMYFIEYINIGKEKGAEKEIDNLEEIYIKTFDSHESIVEVLQYLYRRTNYAKLFLEMFVHHERYIYLLKEQESIINKNLKEEENINKTLIEKYENIKSIIEKYKEWLKQFRNFYPTDELITTSFFSKDIDEILKILNLVAKYLKFKRENSKQIYIPSPLLHRRFRLFNLQTFLKDELYSAIKKLKENHKYFSKTTEKGRDDIKFILNSDYDVGDLLHEYGRDIALVKGSFFWREMVRLYPMLMHEIAHTLVYYLSKNLKNDLASLVENLYFRPNRNIFVDDNIFFTRRDLNELMYDIFSDFIAFLLFRDSYILSFITYGGLGYLFFDTFVSSPLIETDEYKFYTFENLYSDVNFDPKRESTIIRLKVLIELREQLKKDKITKKWGEIIDKNLIKEMKIYLNDLFAIYRDEYNPLSFYLASEKQQKSINAIKGLIKSISRAMLSEMKKFKHIFDLNIEPFLSIYSDDEPVKQNGKIEYFLKTYNLIEKKDVIYKINIYRKNNKTNIAINKQKDVNLNEKRQESLLSIIWKNKIKTLEEETLKTGILEGSILRSFVNTFKYCEIFDDNLSLETDYLNFVKSKKIFREFSDKNKTFKDSITDYLNNEKEENSNNKEDIYKFFLLADFTTFFFKRDLYPNDYSEVKLYSKAIEYTGFLDRHSILKASHISMENLKKRWLGLILVKFNTADKYVQGKRVLLKKEITIDEYARNDLKRLREFIQEHLLFFAFSAGWEDFILLKNTDDLDEIFDIMSTIQGFEFIKRTETVIGYNMDYKNQNLEKKHQKDFLTIVNIRFSKILNKLNQNKKIDNNKEENNGADGYVNDNNMVCDDINKSYFQYIFPGRFDSMIVSKKTEREIIDFINLLLQSRSVYEYREKIQNNNNAESNKTNESKCNPIEIEDLVIKVFKNLGNRFVFETDN